ncbi:MAG: Gfo/Idh/MocA family oxidoreductase [Rhodothermales bacterium]
MYNFAITGVAGYIAPRHLRAIKDTGNHLLAACDPHDSVGILDSFYPDAAFFTEIERFDRHLEKQRRRDPSKRLDFMTICSPNHLHDAHVRLALRLDASAICEKPLVLKPSNLDYLQQLEREHPGTVNTVLQLRVHPKLLELRKKLRAEAGGLHSNGHSNGHSEGHSNGHAKRHSIRLTYITSRGTWYKYSWKGDEEKSGGVVTNIGIHFFDMLMWLFGPVVQNRVHVREAERVGGTMELGNADVQWFLSIDENDLPAEAAGRRTYRSITVDDEEIEFSGGFTDLHTRVYEETLAGRGFSIADARPAIELVHSIRQDRLTAPTADAHPLVRPGMVALAA